MTFKAIHAGRIMGLGKKTWIIVVNQVLTSALRVGFNETRIPSGNKT